MFFLTRSSIEKGCKTIANELLETPPNVKLSKHEITTNDEFTFLSRTSDKRELNCQPSVRTTSINHECILNPIQRDEGIKNILMLQLQLLHIFHQSEHILS